jgi:hypothetical protein
MLSTIGVSPPPDWQSVEAIICFTATLVGLGPDDDTNVVTMAEDLIYRVLNIPNEVLALAWRFLPAKIVPRLQPNSPFIDLAREQLSLCVAGPPLHVTLGC